jgi:hypothetical protein
VSRDRLSSGNQHAAGMARHYFKMPLLCFHRRAVPPLAELVERRRMEWSRRGQGAAAAEQAHAADGLERALVTRSAIGRSSGSPPAADVQRSAAVKTSNRSRG